MGIRYPLSVRKDRVFQTPVLIFGIVLMTGMLSFYKHVVSDRTMHMQIKDPKIKPKYKFNKLKKGLNEKTLLIPIRKNSMIAFTLF